MEWRVPFYSIVLLKNIIRSLDENRLKIDRSQIGYFAMYFIFKLVPIVAIGEALVMIHNNLISRIKSQRLDVNNFNNKFSIEHIFEPI